MIKKCISLAPGLLALVPICRLSAQEPVAQPRLVPEDFVAKSTAVRPIEAVQAAEIAGVPAARVTVAATVQLVEDPELPDPPPRPLPPDPADLQVQAQFAADQPGAEESGLALACISATWYPRERVSKVFWQSGGKCFECVSRRNFLHLTGKGGFFQGGSTYALVLAVAEEDTAKRSDSRGRPGRDSLPPPVLPTIPAGLDYLLTAGDATDAKGVQVMADVHEKLRLEAVQLEQEWQAREQAAADRKAELLANPPSHPEVTIRFWKRNRPLGQAAVEGGKP